MEKEIKTISVSFFTFLLMHAHKLLLHLNRKIMKLEYKISDLIMLETISQTLNYNLAKNPIYTYLTYLFTTKVLISGYKFL